MSNRIFALLVLFGVFAGFFLMYIYFFVYYTATIVIQSNVPGYSVELFSKSIAKTFTYSCPDKECVLEDVSPVEYNLNIKKEGYTTFFQNIEVSPSSKQEIVITLEKEVSLESVPVIENANEPLDDLTTTTGSGTHDKISQIRFEKSFDRLFSLSEGKQIGLKDEGNKIQIYYIENLKETLIDTFDKDSLIISVKEVSGTSLIYLGINGNKHLYDFERHTLEKVTLVPEIQYIKPGRVSQELLFITEKGTFIYNKSSKKFTYFYLFHDFVYEREYYIGVIFNDETQKLSNYNLQSETQNLIMKYNPNTLEREVIFRTDIDVEKIIKEGDTIYIVSGDNKYELQNY